MVLLFVHMPKCGGSSLKESLEKAYGDQVQLLYRIHPRLLHQRKIYYCALHPRRVGSTIDYYLRSAGLRQPKIKGQIIYGHYTFGYFRFILSKPSTKTGTFFRDPVEWAGSALHYGRRKKPHLSTGDDLVDIKRLAMPHTFREYMGPLAVEKLDYVGIVENYSQSLALYERIFGRTLSEEKENSNPNTVNYRQYFQEKNILPQVENLMADNKILYEKALTRHHQLCAQYMD